MPEMMRLQKFLAQAGVCSRRQAEDHIRKGRVVVNGRMVKEMGVKIDPDEDAVEIFGRRVLPQTPEINILVNKPEGYISSCRHAGRNIVLDLVDVKERVYPAGRLDRDSCGLLLLTNNGPLHYRLTHPSFDHEKEYEVWTREPIAEADLEKLAGGIVLDGRLTRRAKVRRRGDAHFSIVLKEGRNRQIRRMVEAVGNGVTRLKRVRMANLRLGKLAPGQWRYLTDAETAGLKKLLGL